MTVPTPQNGPLNGHPVNKPSAVLELHPDEVLSSPLNREVTLDSVKKLLPSIRAEGQLQNGKVRRHPTVPGKYECLIGHRRLFCCRILAIRFKAELVEEPLSNGDIIRMQLTENLQRDGLTFFDISDKVEQFMREENCNQLEAAQRLSSLGSASKISRAMTTSTRLCPSLRSMVESNTLGRSNSYLIATLESHEQQQQVAERVVKDGLKRDAVAKLVKAMKGQKREPKRKPHRAEYGKATLTYPYEWSWENLADLAEAIKDAIKRGQKIPGATPSAFPGLLQG